MPSLTQMAQLLQTWCGAYADTIARQTGLIRRTRRLSGSILLVTLVFGFLADTQASYNELAQLTYRLGVTVTRQALAFRMAQSECVEFLRQVWQQLLS